MQVKKLLLDTNIYGFLARDFDREKLIENIKKSKSSVIYGSKIIRNELRDIPKKIKFEGRSVRIDILNLFDQIVKNHLLEVNDKISDLGESYYNAYREFGGSKSKGDILVDFKIVACASYYDMDIVVSSDEKTMLTENAMRAYKLVNSIAKKRTPEFIDFIEFKKYLRGGKSNELV